VFVLPAGQRRESSSEITEMEDVDEDDCSTELVIKKIITIFQFKCTN